MSKASSRSISTSWTRVRRPARISPVTRPGRTTSCSVSIRRSDMRAARRPGSPWRHLGIAALAAGFAGSIAAQALKIGTLRVESVPAAAEVEVIGGTAGVTPLSISERDIYPNNYEDARADMYGMVVL